MRVVRALPVVALILACTSAQRVIGSVAAFEAMGETRVATGKLMNLALDRHAITEQQYRDWADFARRFDRMFPVAGDMLKAAVEVGDDNGAQLATAELNALAANLSVFTSIVMDFSTVTDGGSP